MLRGAWGLVVRLGLLGRYMLLDMSVFIEVI
jgi:hypothetical protein